MKLVFDKENQKNVKDRVLSKGSCSVCQCQNQYSASSGLKIVSKR
jgi:hypothetical protein